MSKIELNEDFRKALDLMENSDKNVFVTGRAGTGKSTLLSYFQQKTKKRVVVLAPTGVAALNVKGQTIHSFFGFKPNVTPDQIKKSRSPNGATNIYKKIDTIIIDEVSMVRADLLDCVDKFLRLHGPKSKLPFGGIQMVFIGDLYQLPPVVTKNERDVFKTLYKTPYFYSAKAFETLDVEFVELDKIYRQHDQKFIDLLGAIRNKTITDEDMELLNSRVMPDFEPDPEEFFVYLTTTNKRAEEINEQHLFQLKGMTHVFKGAIKGDFGNEYLPTALELKVKEGAQIMLLNNDSLGRWVNGSIGKIIEIYKDVLEDDQEEYVIVVELSDGREVEVTPHTWEIYDFYVDGDKLKSQTVGKFRQYPMMLAWAVTIHKSQGKTFDKVIIDIGRGAFAHGQVYVALSRCTSLEGIILKKPIKKEHIWMDWNVVHFLTECQYSKAEEMQSLDDKIERIREAINENLALEIVYLKPNNEKSKRIITPFEVGEMEYKEKKYIGVRAFCNSRQGERVFRVDRILSLKVLESPVLKE
ncbi:AAA family ATPase [Acetomicrobium sp. UBA5826]|uniref:AAA family ATPase n=1 Tax=Acetomicrobium sp. UBA5826 TaxID=1946039 RepID=UPI00257CB61C|nr:AAA family ATPase [Acetomicrobium sp. UBA5826]